MREAKAFRNRFNFRPQQDDVGGFPGQCRCPCNGDAQVCLFERWGVVNAVPAQGWHDCAPATPLVDVLICTYNEEAAILERTIVGALAQTYPNFRVWLLDDGRRPEIAALCGALGCFYLTREDNRHAKAGNINAAIRTLTALNVRPDFVAILDADFVPFPKFVERAMALHKAPDVGIVQTPQHFINPDPIQTNLDLAALWPDEQRFFFDTVMASKDAWDQAFCCGTSSIIRFEPLVRIGGFPTDSVTEDFLLSLRFKEAGYSTVYLNEPLSLGLAPEGLREYLTQRGRWCLGFMQIIRGKSGPFSRSANLSLMDRVVLVENFLAWSVRLYYARRRPVRAAAFSVLRRQGRGRRTWATRSAIFCRFSSGTPPR